MARLVQKNTKENREKTEEWKYEDEESVVINIMDLDMTAQILPETDNGRYSFKSPDTMKILKSFIALPHSDTEGMILPVEAARKVAPLLYLTFPGKVFTGINRDNRRTFFVRKKEPLTRKEITEALG